MTLMGGGVCCVELIRKLFVTFPQGYDYGYYRNLTSLRFEKTATNATSAGNETTTTTTTTTAAPPPTNSSNVTLSDNGSEADKFEARDPYDVPEVEEPHLTVVTDTIFVWLRLVRIY